MFLTAFLLIVLLSVTEGQRFPCGYLFFECKNEKCIPTWTRCDDHDNCGDNSDERYCETGKSSLYTSAPLADAIKSIPGIEDAKRNLTQYFLNTRQSTNSIYKWGPDITKTAVALFLTDKQFFAPGNSTGEDIAFELSLKLMSKLAKKRKISVEELSKFINALMVACVNPRDFFGLDLVSEVRKRVNNHEFPIPLNSYAILTLCNANDSMTKQDIGVLDWHIYRDERHLFSDSEAMSTMTKVCIKNRQSLPMDANSINYMALEFLQMENGTTGNVRNTALVVQALLASDRYQSYFDMTSAVKYLLHQVRSTNLPLQDLYYILPILNSVSLVNISSDHCVTPTKIDLEVIENLLKQLDEYITVHISIYIGDKKDSVQTWKLKVPLNYSMYDVLETIGTKKPKYKVEYGVAQGKPYVTRLKSFQDSLEDNIYWFMYTKPFLSTREPKLIDESPVDYKVKKNDELILWYKSKKRDESQENNATSSSTTSNSTSS